MIPQFYKLHARGYSVPSGFAFVSLFGFKPSPPDSQSLEPGDCLGREERFPEPTGE